MRTTCSAESFGNRLCSNRIKYDSNQFSNVIFLKPFYFLSGFLTMYNPFIKQ